MTTTQTLYRTSLKPYIDDGGLRVSTSLVPTATITIIPPTIEATAGPQTYIIPSPVTGLDGYVTVYRLGQLSTVVIKAQSTQTITSSATHIRSAHANWKYAIFGSFMLGLAAL